MDFVKRADIEDLLSVKPGNALFLSVFLSTSIEEKNKRETEIFLKKKVRQFEKYFAGQEPRTEEFRRNIQRLQAFLDQGLHRETRGVAVFLSAGRDYIQTFQLSVRIPNRFVVGDAPAIEPLAKLIEQNTHHCVVLLDSHQARILSVYLWRVLEERQVSEEVPRKTKVGGWSQPRFQRHRQDRVHHFYKELAEALEIFVEKEKPDDIVLLGQERNTADFKKTLSANLQQKIAFTEQMDIATQSQDVVRRLRPILEAERDKASVSLVQRLEDQVRHDHLAVGGLEDTLSHLLAGRIDTLVLDPATRHVGLRCRDCAYLFATRDSEGCPFCQGTLDPVDLNEKMIEVAEKHRTRIEFVKEPNNSFIAKMDGVGAFLRF